MSAIRDYEFELSRALIGVIESVPGTRIYGVTDMDRLNERVPTVSFRLEGKDPAQMADTIGSRVFMSGTDTTMHSQSWSDWDCSKQVAWSAWDPSITIHSKKSNNSVMY
jgi:hypothetical protein